MPSVSRFALKAIPLFVVQAALDRIVVNVHRDRPRLFVRMGAAAKNTILIDPTDMPFVILLSPDDRKPSMQAFRSSDEVTSDAQIKGTFPALFRMIDAQLDGDALFFSRDLKITGDLETVVALRNAMDDVDGSIAGDVAALFGPPGQIFLSFMRHRQMTIAHV